MGPILEDQCNNLEFVLTRAPTFVMYKFGQNPVTTAVNFFWKHTEREGVQCIPDPQQHVVFHGFDGRRPRCDSVFPPKLEPCAAHMHMILATDLPRFVLLYSV